MDVKERIDGLQLEIAANRRRIAELEAFIKELRADLDAEHGRKRVDVNWPKFANILGD